MADHIRMGGLVAKDRMDTPSSGSDDEGGVGVVDLAHLPPELDQDEFDGPLHINGKIKRNEYKSLMLISQPFIHSKYFY